MMIVGISVSFIQPCNSQHRQSNQDPENELGFICTIDNPIMMESDAYISFI